MYLFKRTCICVCISVLSVYTNGVVYGNHMELLSILFVNSAMNCSVNVNASQELKQIQDKSRKIVLPFLRMNLQRHDQLISL